MPPPGHPTPTAEPPRDGSRPPHRTPRPARRGPLPPARGPDSPGRLRLALLAGLACSRRVLWSFVTNPRWEWGVVAQWFFAESIIRGLLETVKLTVLAGAVGFGLGLLLALMRLSPSALISGVSWTFSWIFRSTPLLVQLLLWYNLGYLYERITLGIPLTEVTLLDARTSDLMTPMIAAVLGLGLHQAAYAAELIRGGSFGGPGPARGRQRPGIPARDRSLRIVLPQAMRAILPTAFNEISSAWSRAPSDRVRPRARRAVLHRAADLRPHPAGAAMLLVATVWYVVITLALSVGQYYIERHLQGAVRTLPPTPPARARTGRRPVTAGAAACR